MKASHLLSFLIVLGFFGCQSSPSNPQHPEPSQSSGPNNIILLIGDGMGLAQLSTAYYYNDSSNFSRFPVIGLINTTSKKEKITDSAAGATAFATGKRTYNGAISLDTDSTSITTIIEALSEQQFSTGLISTSSITHATPACFYAHAKHRNLEEDIALQLANSPVDFFAGGGLQFFNKRTDGKNLLDSLNDASFTIDTFNYIQPSNTIEKYGCLLAENGLPKANEREDSLLAKLTQSATSFLSQKESNFFLMVEGSQIDWGGHANDAEWLISEVLDFDKAVGTALDFAKKDGNTLVIVTADHETGGFALAGKDTLDEQGLPTQDYNNLSPRFSTHGHTTTLIPVLAFGPGQEKFAGIYNNTAIHQKIMECLTEE